MKVGHKQSDKCKACVWCNVLSEKTLFCPFVECINVRKTDKGKTDTIAASTPEK